MKSIITILLFFVNLSLAAEPNNAVFIFHGTSDASAAVAIGTDKFIVGDDENNILRIYKTGISTPLFALDLTKFLDITAENPEADIEAAAKIGNRIYWITSHGRNTDGKPRPNRHRFFATEIVPDGNSISIRPVGLPYRDLILDLVGTESEVQKDLERAAGLNSKLKRKDLEKLAPKNEGLNIEGLCASADSNTLYIGLRNPQHKKDSKKYAIVVPLKNADSVIEKGRKPLFSAPLLWDLDGLGIRDMAYSPFHKAFFIIAGPADESQRFALYRWSGRENEQPKLTKKLDSLPDKFTPEAIIPFDNTGKILLLSDDGSVKVKIQNPADCLPGRLTAGDLCLNKYLADPSKKTFRALFVQP